MHPLDARDSTPDEDDGRCSSTIPSWPIVMPFKTADGILSAFNHVGQLDRYVPIQVQAHASNRYCKDFEAFNLLPIQLVSVGKGPGRILGTRWRGLALF